MGSGGGASASGGTRYTTADNTVRVVEPSTIRGGYGTDREDIAKVLEVTAKSNGEISLKENYGKVVGGSRKYPVTEYDVKGAYIITSKNYNAVPEASGINWDNVKQISGSTYGIGTLAKQNGLEWDSKERVWKKK